MNYDSMVEMAQKRLGKRGRANEITIYTECKAPFLLRGDGVECLFCNYKATGEKAAQLYIANVLGISNY